MTRLRPDPIDGLFTHLAPGDPVIVTRPGGVRIDAPPVYERATVLAVIGDKLALVGRHPTFDRRTGEAIRRRGDAPRWAVGRRLVPETPENVAALEAYERERVRRLDEDRRHAREMHERQQSLVPRAIAWLRAADETAVRLALGENELLTLAESLLARGELPELGWAGVAPGDRPRTTTDTERDSS